MEIEVYDGAQFEFMKIKRESADEISISRCHVVRTIETTRSAFLGTKPYRPKSHPVYRRIDPEKHIAVNLLLFKVTYILEEDGTSKEVENYGRKTRFTTWVNWVNFFKGGDEREECKKKLADFLDVLHVPEDAHPKIVEKISQGIDATVNNVLPLYLDIYNILTLEEDDHQDATNAENIKKELLAAVDSCCAFCQGDYYPQKSGYVTTLVRWRCGHYYHKHCSDAYFKESMLCPLCGTPAMDLEF